MNLLKYFDKNNLHHAYLIEGEWEEVLPQVTDFLKSLKIKILNNPDLVQISVDTFKIEDARHLKSYASQKGLSKEKKIFIISANSFLLEAQNSMLKLFEEPIENTFFFIITPDASTILKTLLSRIYFISTKGSSAPELKDAEKFIKMTQKARLDFIKELLTVEEAEDEEGNEIPTTESARSKALKFLSSLESSLHQHAVSRFDLDIGVFQHLFKVREFLRMPGSSPKTLMESVALITPHFS